MRRNQTRSAETGRREADRCGSGARGGETSEAAAEAALEEASSARVLDSNPVLVSTPAGTLSKGSLGSEIIARVVVGMAVLQ